MTSGGLGRGSLNYRYRVPKCYASDLTEGIDKHVLTSVTPSVGVRGFNRFVRFSSSALAAHSNMIKKSKQRIKQVLFSKLLKLLRHL